MVSCALGPTVSDVPSRNTRWARSRALVVMTSLACTSMPMRRTRSASEGGLPRGSPSVAEVTPTRAAASGMPNGAPDSAIAVVPSSMARTIGKPRTLALTISSPWPVSEAPADAKHHIIIDELVVRQVGAA